MGRAGEGGGRVGSGGVGALVREMSARGGALAGELSVRELSVVLSMPAPPSPGDWSEEGQRVAVEDPANPTVGTVGTQQSLTLSELLDQGEHALATAESEVRELQHRVEELQQREKSCINEVQVLQYRVEELQAQNAVLVQESARVEEELAFTKSSLQMLQLERVLQTNQNVFSGAEPQKSETSEDSELVGCGGGRGGEGGRGSRATVAVMLQRAAVDLRWGFQEMDAAVGAAQETVEQLQAEVAALRLLHAQQGGAEESEISAGGQVLVTNREMLVTNREIRGTAGGREALVTNLTTNWAVVANREAVVTNRQAVLTPLRDVAAVVAASLRDVVRATEAGIDAAEDTLGYAHQTLNPKP